MRNTFNNFIVNDSNKEAFEFANKVAKEETIKANPLFINGPHGCGKSHLLDAIWCYYVAAKNGKYPEWIASFALESRLSNLKQDDEELLNMFEAIDLLLIDDIDLIDDKSNGSILTKAIEGFVKRGKQLCVTSKKSLDELPIVLKDFLSTGKFVKLDVIKNKENNRNK